MSMARWCRHLDGAPPCDCPGRLVGGGSRRLDPEFHDRVIEEASVVDLGHDGLVRLSFPGNDRIVDLVVLPAVAMTDVALRGDFVPTPFDRHGANVEAVPV